MTKRRDRSGRSSVTVKKKRSADTEQLMLCGRTPLSAWWTWKRRIASGVAAQAAHGHVFEHALPQQAYGL